ncbi:O-antigen ligase family protein [Microbacterium betulae]|uniref:O-antigen ligase family protein n=1 Tax=Microbacterium betulae TaxID=2981139 RepID=A0AA97I6H8_9MICO|nr:O-antigen ligase family protein [Microbacterium sp. AB]WOF22637.1 O-antigen ligase family protein [Microbacterium sp. AB]
MSSDTTPARPGVRAGRPLRTSFRPSGGILLPGAGAGRPSRTELPRWPLTAMFAAFPLWWALGLAEMAWIPLAGAMAVLMVRRGGMRAPRGFGVWLLFLVLVGASVVGVDTSGRLIGFAYRGLQYLAVTIAFLYVYNARRTVTVDWLLGLLTLFWLYVVAGGWLGVVAPEFSFRTPLGYLLPQALQANEVVGEMVVRRATQWNPDSWIALDPRPAAPFLYTNGWGGAYSMLLPLVLTRLARMPRDGRFLALLAAVPVSFVPAFLTLNRGMFIGLGIAALYGGTLLLASGRARAVAGLAAASVAALGAASALGVWDRLLGRVESSSSTEDRANLYEETLTRTLRSPLFGYGAPRPSWTEGAPSAGTQGHVWTVMFSHGLPALALFLGALLWLVWATGRARTPGTIAVHVIQVVLLVEVFYYGVLPHGLMLALLPAAAILPHDSVHAVHPSGTPSSPRRLS